MIRTINANDKEIFIKMVTEFYNSEAVLHSIPKENIINTFEEITSNSPFTVGYIVEINSEVAGYILLSFTYSNEAGGLTVLLEEIFVKEEFRGLGLGSKMINYTKEKYSNAKRFRLEVENDNVKAINLYKSLGFNFLNYGQMYFDK